MRVFWLRKLSISAGIFWLLAAIPWTLLVPSPTISPKGSQPVDWRVANLSTKFSICWASSTNAQSIGLRPFNMRTMLINPLTVLSGINISKPGIFVCKISIRGLTGSRALLILLAMGVRKSVTKLPTSIRKFLIPTVGARTFLPSSQFQLAWKSPPKRGNPLAPSSSKVMPKSKLALTPNLRLIVLLRLPEKIRSRVNRPRASPSKSNPNWP